MSTRKTGEDDGYEQLDEDIEHVADEVGRLAERVKAAETKLATLGKRADETDNQIRALQAEIAELRRR